MSQPGEANLAGDSRSDFEVAIPRDKLLLRDKVMRGRVMSPQAFIA